jgi:serine phosphatase RsbU (regulator of sigma subunit)
MMDGSNNLVSPNRDDVLRLSCLEVWGGNRRVNHAVELPGLEGWVHSEPTEDATSGGDVHYLSVCSKGILSRFTLADVSGHGQSSSAVAQILQKLINKYIDTWDQSQLMRDLNESLQMKRGQHLQFATAAFFAYLRPKRELVFTNAGHPPALWYRARNRSWHWLEPAPQNSPSVEGLPLGLIPGTEYVQAAVKLELDDRIILYTDGITEAKNDSGAMLGADGLLKIAHNLPIGSPQLMADSLLTATRAFREGALRDDDESFMVLRHLEPGS